MKRNFLTMAAAASLMLCIAALVPWLRSLGGADARFSWGRGVDIGYGYIASNEIRYADGTLFFLRARGPLVSLASPSLPSPRRLDVYWLGLHARHGYWAIAPSRSRAPHQLQVWFPGWWVPAAAAIAPAAWLWAGAHRRRGVPIGCCPTCGYDLRATPDRYPECGALPVGSAA